MDDLISRQAAIDEVEFGITYAKAIDKETDEVIELFKASNAELKKAIDRIKALHAAQPQRMRGRWKQTYLDHVAMGERPYILYCSACN